MVAIQNLRHINRVDTAIFVRNHNMQQSIVNSEWTLAPFFFKGSSLDVFRMELLALFDELVNSPEDVSG